MMRVYFIRKSDQKKVKEFRQTTQKDEYFMDEFKKAKKKLESKKSFIGKFEIKLVDNNGKYIA